MASGVAVSAAVFFVSILALASPASTDTWGITEATMRFAVTGTIVLVYLELVPLMAFYFGKSESSEVSKMFVESFTSLVKLVVSFYITVSGATEASKRVRIGHRDARGDDI